MEFSIHYNCLETTLRQSASCFQKTYLYLLVDKNKERQKIHDIVKWTCLIEIGFFLQKMKRLHTLLSLSFSLSPLLSSPLNIPLPLPLFSSPSHFLYLPKSFLYNLLMYSSRHLWGIVLIVSSCNSICITDMSHSQQGGYIHPPFYRFIKFYFCIVWLGGICFLRLKYPVEFFYP